MRKTMESYIKSLNDEDLYKKEYIEVLSLFDGISCGRKALEKAKIPINKYYASEIDKYAIQITQKNYPNTIQLGNVENWKAWPIDWSSIDLLIGGSPCQGFSFAGKQLNFNDERSKLFFVYVDILEHIKKYNPNIKFLLENVKMKKEYQEIITEFLGVEPIEINSALVSAQNRRRLYWANWNFCIPKDSGIFLKDIVHENTITNISPTTSDNKSYALTASYDGAVAWNSYERKQRTMLFEELSRYIVPFDKTLQILDKEVRSGKVGYFRKDSQANRVYYIHDKAVTLCGEAGGGAAKMGQYLFGNIQTPRGKNKGGLNFKEKSPSITSSCWEHNNHLLFGCITPDRLEKRQNGQKFNNGKKFYTLTAQDKHGILIEGYIRKLTPIECERLQTLPDNYTQGISNAQRYKCLGNGWTVDVIAHIFRHLNNNEDKFNKLQQQNAKLVEVLENTFKTLIIANNKGLINDHIWVESIQTLFDYIATQLGIPQTQDYMEQVLEEVDFG